MENTLVFDGPAGAGKSTVAKLVAKRLGFQYLDTGAIYRTFGLWSQRQNITFEGMSEADLQALFDRFEEQFLITLSPDAPIFSVAEENFTEAIRTAEGSQAASTVAQIPKIRARMVALFRKIMQSADGVVAEGRDLTTVVAPDATLRVIITADEAVRMARRSEDGVAAEKLVAEIRLRDAKDSAMVNFTEPAEGVHLIDTTLLTIDEVVDEVLNLYQVEQTQK